MAPATRPESSDGVQEDVDAGHCQDTTPCFSQETPRSRMNDGFNDSVLASTQQSEDFDVAETARYEADEDEASWATSTRSCVSTARALRQEILTQFREPLCAREPPPDYATISKQLQKRMLDWQSFSQQLLARIERSGLALQQLRVCIVHVHKEHEDINAPMAIAETRLALRCKRPPEESLRDKFQEALESEQQLYHTLQTHLLDGVNRGRTLMVSIEGNKADMARELQGGRTALRADRSNLLYGCFHGNFTETKRTPQRSKDSRTVHRSGSCLLSDSQKLESQAMRYLNDYSDSSLRAIRRDVERAVARTNTAMKKRICETTDLKIQLEKEMAESGLTMSAAEQFLQHLRSMIREAEDSAMDGVEDGQAAADKHAHTKWLLEERIQRQESLVKQLKKAHARMSNDLKLKTEVLNIDASCLKVRDAPLLSRSSEGDRQDGVARLLTPREDAGNLVGQRRPKRLPPDVLDQLRSKIKGAAYTGTKGRELDVLLRRFDKDGSGCLEEVEVRAALRRSLKIPASVISDQEITALCAELDADRSGSISIMELVDFVGADPTVSKRSGKSLLPSMPKSPLNTTAKLGLNGEGPVDHESRLAPPLVHAGSRSVSDDEFRQLPRKRRPKLPPQVLERLRAKIKSASYMGHLGSELDTLFGRFDKDGTGQLDDSEVRLCVRRSLRIPPSEISDSEISSLCAMLDADGSGTVSIDELVAFIGPGSAISKRTGKADLIVSLLSARE